MATLTIDDRTIELPVYKLKLLKKAAPFMDEVMAIGNRLAASRKDGAAPAVQLAEHLLPLLDAIVETLAVGAVTVDPTLTAEALRERFGIADLPALQTTFAAVIREAGVGALGSLLVRPAEAPAPAAQDAPEVSAELAPAPAPAAPAIA